MGTFNMSFWLLIFAAFFIGGGVLGLLGVWKSWYWRSPRSIFGYIPFGLMFALSAYEQPVRAALGSAGNVALIVIYSLLFALGSWGFIRPPRAIKPAWIRTIEQEPPYVYKAMAEQARGNTAWRERVATPEALANWIREIQRSRRLAKK